MRVTGGEGQWAVWLRGLSGTVLMALGALLLSVPAQAAGKHEARRTHAAAKHAATPSTKHAGASSAKSKQRSAHAAKADRKSTAQAKNTPASRHAVARGGKASAHGRREVVARKGKAHSRSERLAARRERLTLHRSAQAAPPPRLSFGQMAGLHEVHGPLDLKSGVALVMDQDTREVLLSKNDHAVLPIASLTKLMTGLVISSARLPMDEMITITDDDIDTEKNSRSRLAVGTELSRGELLHLALMSSENRAAHALGRTYPGGLGRFVGLMNARAAALGMVDTHYVEPTGLSSANQSSAQDLARLVAAASHDPLLRQLTTSPSYEVAVGSRMLQFHNTNGLVRNPEWDIGLQKTGFINEAGRCLVMQTRIAGRRLIMVLLDSAGKYSRFADAERVRRWVETQPHISTVAARALAG